MSELIAVLDIPAYRNDSLIFEVDFYLDEAKTNPFDLTNFAEYRLQVKKQSRDTWSVISLELGNGLEITPPNTMVITFDKSITDQDPRVYFYDLEANNPLGERKTLMRGNFTISQDVTRE